MNRFLSTISFPNLPTGTALRSYDRDLRESLEKQDAAVVAQLNSQVQSVGAVLQSSKIITVNNPTHHIAGSQTIQTINAPSGFSGPIWLVANGSFSLGTAGNIAIAVGPFSPGQSINLVFDPNTSKWYPAAIGAAGPPGPPGPAGSNAFTLITLPFASSPYNATFSWALYLVSAGASDFIFNLPAATGTGKSAAIKKMDATAFNIDVTPHGTDTIDGVNAAVAISLQYDVIRIADAGTGTWAIW